MNCPEHLVFKSRWLWIWMYWRDVPRKTIPLRVWLNPLNYEIGLHGWNRVLVMNRKGQWVRNRLWRIQQAMKRVFAT